MSAKIDKMKEIHMGVKKLVEINKVLEEAVKFYADENNHKSESTMGKDGFFYETSKVKSDKGKKARKALYERDKLRSMIVNVEETTTSEDDGGSDKDSLQDGEEYAND